MPNQLIKLIKLLPHLAIFTITWRIKENFELFLFTWKRTLYLTKFTYAVCNLRYTSLTIKLEQCFLIRVFVRMDTIKGALNISNFCFATKLNNVQFQLADAL